MAPSSSEPADGPGSSASASDAPPPWSSAAPSPGPAPAPRTGRAPGASGGGRRVAVGLGLVWVLLLGNLWWNPLSPTALERGDTLYGLGHAEAAFTHYQRVAAYNPLPGLRWTALERAATLAAVDLHDPARSRLALQRLIEDPDLVPTARARAWSRLGYLLRDDDPADPADAASAFRMAYEADPEAGAAGDWLVEVARAHEASGDLGVAFQTWERVARHAPAHRATARLGQAAILLGKGEVSKARDKYADAAEAAATDSLRQVARLGLATCKDRLARMESALASAESDDLTEAERAARQERLEAHREEMGLGTDL